MTMHLLGPQYSTIKGSKPKTKLTKTKLRKLQQEWRQHNKSLKQRNEPTITFDDYVKISHGERTQHHRELERTRTGKSRSMKDFTGTAGHKFSLARARESQKYPSAGMRSGIAASTSIMDPHNLQRESADVREAVISKSQRVAPAYNKGGYQYLTDETDLTSVGKKNVS